MLPDEVAQAVIAGEARAVARLISGLEDGDQAAAAALAVLRRRGHRRDGVGGRDGGRGGGRDGVGGFHLVGITGPPGSGKSTLCDKLIGALRRRGSRVGVLAVDPSSPFTGGALLGDRLRMQDHGTDEGVFIRSLAARGRLGGLSRATAAAARVLDAAGYDIVLIETVGVGQSEVDVVRIADTVVLVSVPGLGDDIQVIKAGIMEIGDVFVVNKSDREGADRVVREIRVMLETAAALARPGGRAPAAGPDTLIGHHRVASAALTAAAATAQAADRTGTGAAAGAGLPPVLKTVAETGEGVEELLDAILAHRRGLEDSGALAARRLEAARAEMRGLIAFRLLDELEGPAGSSLEGLLARRVADRELDAYEAADELFAALAKRGNA